MHTLCSVSTFFSVHTCEHLCTLAQVNLWSSRASSKGFHGWRLARSTFGVSWPLVSVRSCGRQVKGFRLSRTLAACYSWRNAMGNGKIAPFSEYNLYYKGSTVLGTVGTVLSTLVSCKGKELRAAGEKELHLL